MLALESFFALEDFINLPWRETHKQQEQQQQQYNDDDSKDLICPRRHNEHHRQQTAAPATSMTTPWERIRDAGFRDYLKELGYTADDYNGPNFDRGKEFNNYKQLQQQPQANGEKCFRFGSFVSC